MESVGRPLFVAEAAQRLGIASSTLATKTYRRRIGLMGRKLGGRLIFLEPDLEDFLRRTPRERHKSSADLEEGRVSASASPAEASPSPERP